MTECLCVLMAVLFLGAVIYAINSESHLQKNFNKELQEAEHVNMTAYTIIITVLADGTHYKRTVTSNSLPRVIKIAHAVIDSIWYDFDINAKGQLIITNAGTGEICWTETITPFEE